MHFHKVKVRTKNPTPITPCAAALTDMLTCWASHGDLRNTGLCATYAMSLFACMRSYPPMVRRHKPSINYHLARLRNQINR